MGFLAQGLAVVLGALWTRRSSAANNDWTSICYGNGLFVAVASSGAGNRVMTSPDGINWTIRVSAADNQWTSICYGNGLFVAVSNTGAGNRVMTSPDGINWTIRVSAANVQWYSVCYGNGLFVAVASSGAGNRVMTSPDGINWTIRVSAADNNWRSVCHGNGLFVAVSNTGAGNRVMTSPDGINWTSRTVTINCNWASVCYGNGLFVAVPYNGTGNYSMYSVDGITWTVTPTPIENTWSGVCYGDGLFVAVCSAVDTASEVMTSPNGIDWTIRSTYGIYTTGYGWLSVCYGNGLFVTVTYAGTGNRVMTSGAINNPPPQPNAFSRKIDTAETANRALNTTYTNNSGSTLLVRATFRSVISLAGGIAYVVAYSDSAAPPITNVSGGVGIVAGLLNEDNNFQCVFTVAPGMNYRLNSTATNGTVTIAQWFEMRF